jgi:hypothetical protein
MSIEKDMTGECTTPAGHSRQAKVKKEVTNLLICVYYRVINLATN